MQKQQNAKQQKQTTMKIKEALSVIQSPLFDIVATKTFEATEGSYSAIPHGLPISLTSWLSISHPNGLYTHQAEAVKYFLEGLNVGLMTPTSSGKSLIFQICTAHLIKTQPGAKVICMYPLVALAKDQERSWKLLEASLGIRVGVLHGGVPSRGRAQILNESDVILATPDIIHSWFMSRLNHPEVRAFREKLKMVVLDEVHSFDGVFGSNAAYFMRRLRACGPDLRFICATATLGEPEKFLKQLTGKDNVVVGSDGRHGTKQKEKHVICARFRSDDKVKLAEIIKALGQACEGQALVFMDNRKETDLMAEYLLKDGDDHATAGWMAYKSGLEEVDRSAIQHKLVEGTLKGIFATCAMEAGLDIGSVEIVIMIGKPAKARSFTQRLGRLRGEREGIVLIIDDEWPRDQEEMNAWLQIPAETNQLYLDNATLQLYSAACAVHEMTAVGADAYNMSVFDDCHGGFVKALHLAAHPEESFSQRETVILTAVTDTDPQYAFALRNLEPRYKIVDQDNPSNTMGLLTESQVFNEAFPGAIGRYSRRTYRVAFLDRNRKEVRVRMIARTRRFTYATKFMRGFTDFVTDGKVVASDSMILAQVPVNLGEMVRGFTVKNGNLRDTFIYGQNHLSPTIRRTIPTDGVAIAGPRLNLPTLEALLDAYCELACIHPGDLCVTTLQWRCTWKFKFAPQIQDGWTICDRTPGGIRLSQGILERWQDSLDLAISKTTDPTTSAQLHLLKDLSADLLPQTGDSTPAVNDGSKLISILAPGTRGLYVRDHTESEVTILDYVYHPALQAWTYKIERTPGILEFVRQDVIFSIPDVSSKAWFDPQNLCVMTSHEVISMTA
jgi:DEAD/DEAH box helicase domain-containing protein